MVWIFFGCAKEGGTWADRVNKREFHPDYPLVVHWDGKILPDILGLGEVDRLLVLVSGDGTEKLLGVPKLASGTGENGAQAVYMQLEEWGLTNKVQANELR